MKNIFRTMCAVITLAMLMFTFASCTESAETTQPQTSQATVETQEDATEDEGVSTEDLVPMTTHEPGLFIDGEKIDVSTIMTVGDTEISLDLFRYFYLANRMSVDYGDLTIWDTDSEEIASLKDTLLDVTERNVLSMEGIRLLAEQNGVELSEEDLVELETQIDSASTQFASEEEFEAWLESQNMSIDLFEDMMENSLLLTKTIEEVYADDLKTEINEDFVHVQHILITKEVEDTAETTDTDDTAETDEAEDVDTEEAEDVDADTEDALETAQDVLARAQDGEDFETLMKEFSEDPGQPAEGYYFTYGTMVEEFETAAYALAENEISDIVETSYGYHILRRLPMDESYINENIMTLLSGTVTEIELNNDLSELIGALEIVYDENYELIAPDTLF